MSVRPDCRSQTNDRVCRWPGQWIPHGHTKWRDDSRRIRFDHTASPAIFVCRPIFLRIVTAQTDVLVAFVITNQSGRPVMIIVVQAPNRWQQLLAGPLGHRHWCHAAAEFPAYVKRSANRRPPECQTAPTALLQQRRFVRQAVSVRVFCNPNVSFQRCECHSAIGQPRHGRGHR